MGGLKGLIVGISLIKSTERIKLHFGFKNASSQILVLLIIYLFNFIGFLIYVSFIHSKLCHNIHICENIQGEHNCDIKS